MAEQPLPPLLVLLPGLDGTGELFSSFVSALASNIETRIVPYPTDQCLGYAELEALVMAALPVGRRYVLLAESFSGPIGIRIAASPPAGLAGVILCVTFCKNPYPMLGWAGPWTAGLPMKSLPRWVSAPFMAGMGADGPLAEEVERATALVDGAVLRHRLAAVLAVDETDALARISLPAQILLAGNDHVVPRAASDQLLLTLPSAEVVEIDGSHLLLQTRPAECAAAVERFLRTVGSSI